MSGTETRRGLGLTWKLFAATALVVAVVLGATLALTSLLARQGAERSLDQRLANTGEVAREFIEAENEKLARGASAAAQFTPSIAAIVAGDPGTVFDQAVVYKNILQADYTIITDREGILRGHSEIAQVDTVQLGGPLFGGALEGTQTAGFVNRNDSQLFLAVATPLLDLGSTPPVVLGTLLAAHLVSDSLAGEVKRASGSEIVFYVLDSLSQPVIVAASVPRSPALDSSVRAAVTADVVAAGGNMRAEARIGGEDFVGFNRPLINPGRDQAMGGYLVLRSLAQELAGSRRVQRILPLIAGGGLLLALLASFVVARQIAAPIKLLARATQRVAEGDYAAEVPVGSRDEIGELAQSFRRMVDELKAKQQLVEYLSGSSASSAVTQPVYMAGGDVASATMVRSVAGQTGMLVIGQTLAGRYDVKSILGVGGMGVVYRAQDRELGEPVAIKTLKGDAMAADPALLQRFKDEIRLARKITHRNVVRTHDLGEVEGMYYITMEFVEGQSLKHLIQSRGSVPVNVTLTVGKQLCRALEVAHEQGVIHRDIKPQNLIVEPSGTLKVMDFGIARLVTRTDGVTQAGMAIGTPEYMAPEQLLGENVDFRADLYAAGCVLFECVTGRTPFVADNPITLVAKQLEETPPAPSSLNADVPEVLSVLILRTLSKDPALRPQSAAELHDLLDAITV